MNTLLFVFFFLIVMYRGFARTRKSGRNDEVTKRRHSTVVFNCNNYFFLFKIMSDDLECLVVDEEEQTRLLKITRGVKQGSTSLDFPSLRSLN